MATVRKKLQRLGNSRVLLLDRDLLEHLLPDGDLEQELLVTVVGDALVVRRAKAGPFPTEEVIEAAERADALPESVIDLNETEQRLLHTLNEDGPGTTNELTQRIGRGRETTSTRLNGLQRRGWVARTGRDWRISAAGRARLETDPAARFTHLSPNVARAVLALEAGPLTAAELQDHLSLKRQATLNVLKRAIEAGLVTRSDAPVPVYSLRRAYSGSGAPVPPTPREK